MEDTKVTWPSIYQPRREESSTKKYSLRLLCAAANVGGVIGKGGGIIKQIRQESGAFIKVDSSSVEDDCIITVSQRSSLKILSLQQLMLQFVYSQDAVRKLIQNRGSHHIQHVCWCRHHG